MLFTIAMQSVVHPSFLQALPKFRAAMEGSQWSELSTLADHFFEPPMPPMSRRSRYVYPGHAVSALSSEILTLIFRQLVGQYFERFESHPMSSPYSWITVLAVCRLWRSIALEDPFLFRFIDFRQIPARSIGRWVRGCGTLPLTIWVPEEVNHALTVALHIKPDLVGQVGRLVQCVSLTGLPWDKPTSFTALHTLSLRALSFADGPLLFDAASRFEHIRTLHFVGALPGSCWSIGMFPANLEELWLHLDPIDRFTPLADCLTVERLHLCARTLHNLRSLSIRSERLLSGGTQEAFNLPFLEWLSISVPDDDYDVILPLMPTFTKPGRHLVISPHHWDDIHIRVSSDFLKTVSEYVAAREASFDRVHLMFGVRQIRMILQDIAGGQIEFDFDRYTGRPFVSILEAMEVGRVREVVVEERSKEGDFADEVISEPRRISRLFQLLNAVETLTLRGDFGTAARDLLISLAGPAAFAMFPHAGVVELDWPKLTAIKFEHVCRSVVPTCGGNLHMFLALLFMSWPSSGRGVPGIRIEESSFVRFQLIGYWHDFVPSLSYMGS